MKLIENIKREFQLISSREFKLSFDKHDFTYLVVNFNTGTAYEVMDMRDIEDRFYISWIEIDGDTELQEVLEYFEDEYKCHLMNELTYQA